METREISKELIFFLMKIRKYAKSVHGPKLESSVLTLEQFRTIVLLKKFGRCTLKKFSKHLRVSSSSQCIMLNKLYEKGYVDRENDPDDRRNMFYYLTEEGKLLLDNEIELRLNHIDLQIGKLSDDKKKRLFNNLKELEEFLDELSSK